MNEDQIAQLLAPYEAHIRRLTVSLYNAAEAAKVASSQLDQLREQLEQTQEHLDALEAEKLEPSAADTPEK